MEHDELLKRIGEQTLLKNEERALMAEISREKIGLLDFAANLSSGISDADRTREITRINNLYAKGERRREILARLSDLEKITGIK